MSVGVEGALLRESGEFGRVRERERQAGRRECACVVLLHCFIREHSEYTIEKRWLVGEFFTLYHTYFFNMVI